MNELKFESCPLCGGQYDQLYSLPNANIVCCKSTNCGLIFTKNQPDDEELQKLYDTFLYPKGDPTTSTAPKPNSDKHKLFQHFTLLNKKLDLTGKRVLDYGCGIGNFLEIAREGGVAEAMGIELNHRAREWAKKKGFRVEKTIEEFESGIFDLVYMNDVIEHLRNPVISLREIGRVLAPNGAVFLITMDVEGFKARFLREKWDMITEPTHFYFFNKTSLCRTLTEAGYGRVHEEQFFVDFSHHNSLQRIIQRLLVITGMDSGLKVMASNFQGKTR